jgi:hypothetical protein
MPAVWTAPRTWVNNELVDANLMNTHLRDNLEFLSKPNYVVIEDQKPTNTAPQSIAANIYVNRQLNTKVHDPGNLATIASNQITLQPGRYFVSAYAGCDLGPIYFLRLRNITDGADLVTGMNGSGIGARMAILDGFFSISSAKVIELQQYQITNAGVGGVVTNLAGRLEVYTRIILQRIGEA